MDVTAVIEGLQHSLATYYGADWMCMICGLIGMYYMTQKNSLGFMFSFAGCIFGFGAAYISQQYGFVAYNILLMSMTGRALYREGYFKPILARMPSLHRVAFAAPVSLALALPIVLLSF